MGDHEMNMEEQEMEAEALSAIFDEAFETLSPSPPPHKWAVRLAPVDTGGDMIEYEKQNHVAVRLVASLPPLYPEEVGPELDVEIVKGLAEDQRKEILNLAIEEAEANAGMPAIFAVCEAVRAWLADNNVKGQDDGSMYAQMMRKAKEAERSKAQAEIKFEAQKKEEEMTAAELEELAVRKRREEGTPCTKENFLAWKQRFEDERAEKEAAEERERAEKEGSKKNKEKKAEDRSDRLTGFEHFSGKAGMMNLEAIEAAVDTLESGGAGVEELDVDEELFEDEDDLDDLDFDDSDIDDDDDDDEEEEEPDI